jgi:hypothetical protein
MSSVVGGNIVRDGLVLWLDAGNPKSYIGSGTTWSDLTKNGNNGTLVNGPTFNSDNGGSIVFDGVNDYVNIPNSSNLPIVNNLFADVNGEWSVCCWGVSDFDGIGGALVSKGGGIGGSSSFFLGYRESNIYRIVIRGVQTIVNIENIFNFCTITWDGLIAKFYVNGNYNRDLNVGTASLQTFDLNIGGAGNGTTQPLEGRISLMNLYSKALTPQEVLQNYNSTKHRFGL